jgi:sortase A
VAKKRNPKDLSEKELRRLLMEKRQEQRESRLDRFRETGRVIEEVPRPSLDYEETESSIGSLIGHEGQAASVQPKKGKRLIDRLLLVVEVLAIVGLAYLLLNSMNVLNNLNQEVASVLEQPTLEPTPLIMAVVLPSGHTPPTSPSGVQPNDAEIPEHLRPLVQSIADIPVPTPSPEQAVRIQIPSIGVDAPIVQGDGWEQLKKGVGQHLGTPNPGQQGNIVLSAHNDVFGEIFRHLDRMSEGDEVIVFTTQRTYTYHVRQIQVVEPTQVEVMAPTQEPVVTLISCYPYLVDDKRIVVSAFLSSD